MNKLSESKSTTKGERLYIDTSSVQVESLGGAKFWLLVVDDFTDMAWSYFLKAKIEVKSKIIQLIKDFRLNDVHVKKIRCDNAGENFSLQKFCDRERFGVTFEFTGSGSPQYKGRVERKFANLYGKVRARLNDAKLTQHFRLSLWAEACNYATDLENFLITLNRLRSPYDCELFYGVSSPATNNLHQFGEIAVVENQKYVLFVAS